MLSFNQILDIINATQNLTILSRENSLYVIENFDTPMEGSLNIENDDDGIEGIW